MAHVFGIFSRRRAKLEFRQPPSNNGLPDAPCAGFGYLPNGTRAGKCFPGELMKSKIAKRRKTRKHVKQARKDRVPLVLGLTTPPWEDNMLPHEQHARWPAYMKRALPLPDLRNMTDSDKWRQALIEYMASVAVCDGGEYGINRVTGCLGSLSKEETEQLLKDVDQRENQYWKTG
jgi:hypothetical protein